MNIPVVLPFAEGEEINKRTSSSSSSSLSHTNDNGSVYLVLFPSGASHWNANIIKQSGIEENFRR